MGGCSGVIPKTSRTAATGGFSGKPKSDRPAKLDGVIACGFGTVGALGWPHRQAFVPKCG